MKHVIVLAILAVTIPVVAAETKEARPAATPGTTVEPLDSPLVAAAKRSGRLNKKPTFVITNETLAQMKGRLSIATEQQPIAPLQPVLAVQPTEAQMQQQKARVQRDLARAAAEQSNAEARTAKAHARAAQDEDNYLDADPARAEPSMEQTTPKSSEPPTSKPSERPPQN